MKIKKFFLAIIILLALSGTIFCFLAYSNELFDLVASALREDTPKPELEKIRTQYKGKRIMGKAYIKSITRDLSGATIVNLTTKKDQYDPDSVDIILYVREYFIKKFFKHQPGEYVNFFGDFGGIHLRTIIVQKGIVR